MTNFSRSFLLLAVLVALLPDASSGMSQGRNEAQLVFLRFLAIHNGRCVGDLRSEDVEVLENGRRQQVALFQVPRPRVTAGLFTSSCCWTWAEPSNHIAR